MQEAVKRLGRESRDNNKLFAYAKNKLTDFRTEERRKGLLLLLLQIFLFLQIVGLGVYAKYSYFDTKTLHDHLIDSLQSESESTSYIKHLTILVQFIVHDKYVRFSYLLHFNSASLSQSHKRSSMCRSENGLTNFILT